MLGFHVESIQWESDGTMRSSKRASSFMRLTFVGLRRKYGLEDDDDDDHLFKCPAFISAIESSGINPDPNRFCPYPADSTVIQLNC